MDMYSTFEWDILADSPWSALGMSYNPDFSNDSHHGFQQSVQSSTAQEFSTASKQDINIPDGGADEATDSADGVSICSDQCSQVSCIDCCSKTVCQPECLTPCENPDACEVPQGCAITACADSTCLVELPICSNNTCHSPPVAANWQAWQESFLLESHESYDHNMLSAPGGLEAYPTTAFDCCRIIQSLQLHVYGFCSPRTIHQAVIDHIGTYHGQRTAQYLDANPELLPSPYICSRIDQGCPGGFAHGPTAPALSILSFSMGSQHTPPAAFASELRPRDSGSRLAGDLSHSGLGSTSVDVGVSPKKRRKTTQLTNDDLYHYNGTLLTSLESSQRPRSHENDVAQPRENYINSSNNALVSSYQVLEHGRFEAMQQLCPGQDTHGQHDHEQNNDEQPNRKYRTVSEETQEPNVPEQHACMWILNHTSGASCGTTFDSARLLQDHVDEFHVNNLTTAGGMQCQWQHCQRNGKPFEQKLKLMRHVFSHTKDKRFFCKSCGKGFTTEALREQHTRVHTGEKPYPCKICGKHFAYSTALSSHLRVHTREKPLICGVNGCQKAFSESSNLTKHRKSHNSVGEYVCEVCHKDFNRKDGLRRHMKTHDKKPFTNPPNVQQSPTISSISDTHSRRSPSSVSMPEFSS